MTWPVRFLCKFRKVFVNPEDETPQLSSAPTPTHDAMGVDGDASTGDAGDLRDVRLHARQPFHLRLDVAFGLVHAVTCGIAYGPLGAMDGEGAFERVFVVGLGAIAHALVALSTHWSVRHPRRIPRDPHSPYAVVVPPIPRCPLSTTAEPFRRHD